MTKMKSLPYKEKRHELNKDHESYILQGFCAEDSCRNDIDSTTNDIQRKRSCVISFPRTYKNTSSSCIVHIVSFG